ncbi:MAG: HDIG domain-containing metalloprotein [Candidatus Omnitrophota bacterium]
MNKIPLFKKLKQNFSREIFSVILIIMFIGAALYSVFISPHLYKWTVHEGDIALKNVYAPYDFTYFWEIDEESTKRAKDAASRKVPYYLRRDLISEENVISRIEHFFDLIYIEKENQYVLADKIAVLKNEVPASLADKNIKFFIEYTNLTGFQKKTLGVLGELFLMGNADKNTIEYLQKEKENKLIIFNEETGTEIPRNLEKILEKTKVELTVEEFGDKYFEGDRKAKQAAAALIAAYIMPNLSLDDEKTKEQRILDADKVPLIYHSWSVKKNELIIEKGKRVNSRHIAQMKQLRRFLRPGTRPSFFLGILLLFLLLGVIAAVYLALTRRMSLLLETKKVAIILLNMLFVIIVSDFIMRSPQPSYFIPMASIGMTIALLVGVNAAFISVVLMSILISLLVRGGIEVMIALLVGSVIGIYVVRGARRRAKILWAGLLAGVAKLAAIICIGLINDMELDFYLKDGMWSVASGIFSGFIVMGLLPIFEHLFNVHTNISLLELSDLNHPLLKKLAIEASGTYHHSIMVGNLAEAACDAIGADSLRARVGAYYHDIGKIPKAEYFTENEMGAGSKHSKLNPSMSALIISKHVKEGVEIAKKYKLNSTIVDFISQHHGNSLIAYFYQKAIEKSEDGKVREEENFRYPGPKPQTKESAIVLLADSVEASSRTLDEPNPASIRNLVKKIINNKFIDGQLDECDLTLKDMHVIADSFVRVLTGVFHTRLNYPEETNKKTNGIMYNGDQSKYKKYKQKKKNGSS